MAATREPFVVPDGAHVVPRQTKIPVEGVRVVPRRIKIKTRKGPKTPKTLVDGGEKPSPELDGKTTLGGGEKPSPELDG